MLTVLFGLTGAVVYGFADFLGGLASRRIRPVAVTAVAAAIGIVPLLVGLAVLGGRRRGRAPSGAPSPDCPARSGSCCSTPRWRSAR
ncbi:hypothetical protein [Curtobacterium sp. 24E2]|nr:hypothetical protein JN350_06240 [Curtobacterium sp. 24E2]